uniref:DDE Tnp4 domain-containing protein n=1 Tax=Romanomermis culicivorax TaxID=13658 RepID=A0A915IJ01_ROMCU
LNRCNRNHALHRTQLVIITLRFYASKCFQEICGDLVGVNKSMANRAIWRVTNQFENHEFDGLLLGDSGYFCRPWLMTSLCDPQSDAKNRYNRAHKKTRMLIEQTFGRWERRFYYMH